MTTERKQAYTARIEWGLKIAGALGPVVTCAALWWLSQYFVTRTEYDRLAPKVDRIEQTLIRMERQQAQLDDHEARLRALEARR